MRRNTTMKIILTTTCVQCVCVCVVFFVLAVDSLIKINNLYVGLTVQYVTYRCPPQYIMVYKRRFDLLRCDGSGPDTAEE